MPQTGRNTPDSADDPPELLPFPAPEMKPTEFFRLNLPPSNEDTHIRIEYYRPKDAQHAVARPGQEKYVAPDGSAFIFRVSSRPASASTTFRVRTLR